ncbi:MAG: hypothetical protein KGZ80_06125 [Methylomonas sp.]|nr:hypothetical protein [Methylomonas sp.]PPD22245.1 MAG: hypothetical protein CTY23_02790 [Methylomonas sp.]PPD27781.1 MAG: hypothetical protein CTY22_01080 [Methylomonas sp.]PPD39791.1 MAG: hypothetical protein CTY21_01075 [Methylomonas sp.]PPD42565.1 MAG: hypothetical protein CTY17_00970 [Methylomonas sp.]
MNVSDAVIESAIARPTALAALGSNWRALLDAESFNHEACAHALLDVLQRHLPNGVVTIRGISPLTALLCEQLAALPYRVAIDPLDNPTRRRQFCGMPLQRGSVGEAALKVFAKDDGEVAGACVFGIASADVQQAYALALARHRRELAERLNALLAGDAPVVIFVAKLAYYNQLRMSASLRRQGFRTVAITFNPDLREHKSGYFDDVLATDLLSFSLWLQGARGVVLHTQGWLFRYHIPVLIDAFLPDDGQQIVELMDLNSFFLPPDALPQLLPHMRQTWGDDVAALQQVQMACEQYLVHHADGIVYQGCRRIMDLLGGTGRPSRWLQFLCYPLPEFYVATDPERPVPQRPRLVFAGGIPPVNAKHPAALFSDAQLLDTVETIVGQGFALDVYNNPLKMAEEDYVDVYADHLALAERYPNYRFLKGELPGRIAQIISDYDLGLIVYDYADTLLVGAEHFKTLIPSKLFMYLEAGLPVLVSHRAEATAEFVERHGCGLAISAEQLRDLPNVLQGLDWLALRKGVLAARERLSMDSQVQRLIGFYRLCGQPHKQATTDLPHQLSC